MNANTNLTQLRPKMALLTINKIVVGIIVLLLVSKLSSWYQLGSVATTTWLSDEITSRMENVDVQHLTGNFSRQQDLEVAPDDGTTNTNMAIQQVENESLRDVKFDGRISVTQVILSRNDIVPCYAWSFEEALAKCLVGHNGTAFLCETDVCSPESATLAVKDSLVLDPRGVVINPFTGIVFDVSGGCCLQREKSWTIGQVVELSGGIDSENGDSPLLLLKHSHDTTYFHFVFELLSRLVRTPEYIKKMVKEGSIDLLAPNASSFHRRYLEMIICQQTKTPCYKQTSDASKLFPIILLPPPPLRNDSQIQKVFSKARRVDCHPPSQNDTAKPRFIVIKREKNRTVRNLEAFVRLLRESYPSIDFDMIYESQLGQMNLSEYAKFFCNSKGLIGGHGAGLTNMLWLEVPSNSSTRNTVVQIIRPTQSGNYYPEMARVLGYDYVEIGCVLAPGQKRSKYAHTEIVDLCVAMELLHPVLASFHLSHDGRPVNEMPVCSWSNVLTLDSMGSNQSVLPKNETVGLRIHR